MSDVSIGIGETGYYNDTKIRSNVLDQVNEIDFYDLETAKERQITNFLIYPALFFFFSFFACMNSKARKKNLLEIFRDQEFASPGYIAQSE